MEERGEQNFTERSIRLNIILLSALAILFMAGIALGRKDARQHLEPLSFSQWELPLTAARAGKVVPPARHIVQSEAQPLVILHTTVAGKSLTLEQLRPFGEKLDLNRASKNYLKILNGVGEETARSIVAFREEHGGFKHISELLKIRGIGPSSYLKINPYVTISEGTGDEAAEN